MKSEQCYRCNRRGKLILQIPFNMDGEVFVFRSYMCRWHLAADNKWAKTMGPNWPQLKEVEYIPDEELLNAAP